LKELRCSQLKEKDPIDYLESKEKIIEFLTLVNNWRYDGDLESNYSYRDIIPVKLRYSLKAIKYINTPPENR
jgi:hypothetical protein